MADSGDEQVTDHPPTEGAEEVVDSIPADQERSDRVDELEVEKQGWLPLDTAGDEEVEEGLVEEVMKAISASSSPQPGELPEVDLKQPERDHTDSEEAPESSEGVTNEGEQGKVPADAPAETESVPQPEQKPESEVQVAEKVDEAPADEQEPPKEEEPPKEDEPLKEEEPPEEEEPTKEQVVTEQDEEQEKSRGDEHEAGPHWLSAEEVRAKGIAEDCLNKYRRFHLKQAFSVNQWYELLKQCTFETEFVALSVEEVEALLASHHVANPAISEDHKETLSALETKLNDAISKFGEDGVFLKLNTQGTKDVFLEQSDPDHLTSVQEDIVTDVEVDRQTSNAYLIWRSWRSASFRRSETSVGIIEPAEPRQNVLRRSFRRIQRTWHHNRPGSSPSTKKSAEAEAGKEPLAEDTTKHHGEEQPKSDEGGGDPPQSTEKADDKGESAAVEVTAEVTVEAEAKKEAPNEEVEEADSAGQPPATEVSDEAAKAEGGGTEESATTTPKETEDKEGDKPSDPEEPALTVVEEPKGSVAEPQQGQPTAAEDTAKDKKEPSQAKPKPEHGHHGWGGEQGMSHLKEEPMNNRVLRAFKRVVAAHLRVTSGTEAVNRLLRSSKIHQLLTEWKEFSAAEGGTVHVVLRRWNAQILRYPDMLFRAFVFKNKLTALTQHDQTCFTPNIARFKSTIEKKIKIVFADSVQGPLGDYQNYTVDFFVSPNKVLVVDVGPFQSGEHSGLFCWISHHKQLTSTPVQFKVISNARKGDIFSDLPATWKQVCQNVTEQKVGQDSRSKKCAIL